MLELLLSPVNIDVLPDVSVMTDPPEVDILLLKRQTAKWTAAQRALLPDGIRNSKASHILIEFKYTESFNEKALQQALGYDIFFKRTKELSDEKVQTVLLSAKTPWAETLEYLGYFQTEFPGVYRSETPILEKVLLLSLNDLSNEPHNAWIKCFASKKKIKEKTLKQLKTSKLISQNKDLKYLIGALSEIESVLFEEGETEMNMNLTPEQVIDFGKKLGDSWLSGLTPQERIAGLKPSEVLSNFKPSEVLSNFKPSEVLSGLNQAEIEDYLKQLKKQAH